MRLPPARKILFGLALFGLYLALLFIKNGFFKMPPVNDDVPDINIPVPEASYLVPEGLGSGTK